MDESNNSMNETNILMVNQIFYGTKIANILWAA